MKYSFKRNFYYDLEKFITSNINQYCLFLTGPRKCGKTIALKQLEICSNRCVNYVDFKLFKSLEESTSCITKVIESILRGHDIIYALDEITYMSYPYQELVRIAHAYEDAELKGVEIKTKTIFTGSQSKAISLWGHSVFCNSARFLEVSFLQYDEWIEWRNIKDIDKYSYEQFCLDTINFYDKFNSLQDYLEGCLEETIMSNMKSTSVSQTVECDLITSEIVTNTLYLILLTLHNNVSYKTLFKKDTLIDSINYLHATIFKDTYKSKSDLQESIRNSYVGRLNNIGHISYEQLRQSIVFLIEIGLITATPIQFDIKSPINVLSELKKKSLVLGSKEAIVDNINYTFNYPMFYVEIIKEAFKDFNITSLGGYLLGSVFETHARGLLSAKGSFEYRTEEDIELDYVNCFNKISVELTISNKKISNTHFDCLENDYLNILTTRDIKDFSGNIKRIPFAEFIYNLSKYGLDSIIDIVTSKRSDSVSKLDEFVSSIKKEY